MVNSLFMITHTSEHLCIRHSVDLMPRLILETSDLMTDMAFYSIQLQCSFQCFRYSVLSGYSWFRLQLLIDDPVYICCALMLLPCCLGHFDSVALV
jgi:hypothetical protein